MTMNRGDSPRITMFAMPFNLSAQFVDYPYFADYGALVNAAVCIKKGFDIEVVDALAQPYVEPLETGPDHYWVGCRAERIGVLAESSRPDIAVICGHPFINIHARTRWLDRLIGMIQKASPSCRIVYADCYVGGMHFIDVAPEKIFENYPAISHVVKYHSEARLPELLELLTSKPESAPRVMTGSISDVDLDATPVPAWDSISLADYEATTRIFFRALNRAPLFDMRVRTLPAMISRGCLFRCSFCASSPGGGPAVYKRMSNDKIAETLEDYKQKRGAKRIAFLDGLANPSEKEFSELLELLRRNGLKYDFLNGLRADRLTRDHIFEMRNSVSFVSISPESSTSDTIRKIGKGQDPEAAERVGAWCAEIGIPLLAHYVIGFPDEDMESIQRTLEHAAKMKAKYGAAVSVQRATPFPGTRLYDECARNGLLAKTDILDYSPLFSAGGLIESARVSDVEIKKAVDAWERYCGASGLSKVIINLTYVCDNNCVFCAVGDRKKEHVRIEDALRAMREYRRMGARLIDFDGGEPTLYPGLMDAIKAAAAAGFERIAITTNGRRLADEEFARKLMASGITDLMISLYGADARTHETITCAPGSFEQTSRGIRNAAKYAPSSLALCVNTTISATNVDKIPEIAKYAASLGAGKLSAQMLTPFGSARAEHAVSLEQAAPFILKAIEESGEALDIQVVNMPPCGLPGHEDRVAADASKKTRDMVFIGDTGTNLADYLAARRKKDDSCPSCVYNLICDGKYEFE